MTLEATIVLVCAAAHGCTFCTLHQTSQWELDCQERGGHVRTLAATQTCVMDAGHVAGLVRDDDDAGP